MLAPAVVIRAITHLPQGPDGLNTVCAIPTGSRTAPTPLKLGMRSLGFVGSLRSPHLRKASTGLNIRTLTLGMRTSNTVDTMPVLLS